MGVIAIRSASASSNGRCCAFHHGSLYYKQSHGLTEHAALQADMAYPLQDKLPQRSIDTLQPPADSAAIELNPISQLAAASKDFSFDGQQLGQFQVNVRLLPSSIQHHKRIASR